MSWIWLAALARAWRRVWSGPSASPWPGAAAGRPSSWWRRSCAALEQLHPQPRPALGQVAVLIQQSIARSPVITHSSGTKPLLQSRHGGFGIHHSDPIHAVSQGRFESLLLGHPDWGETKTDKP